MNSILIEVIGWFGSVLIVGSFALNSFNKLSSSSPYYQWANIVGGLCFILHTFNHQAYPSLFVNAVWVLIAMVAVLKGLKKRN